MSELRWALIGLSLLFLAGLALWEWRRARRAPGRARLKDATVADITLHTERPHRIEPGLGDVAGVFAPRHDETLEVPSIPMVDVPQDVPVVAGAAVDVPAAARGASGEAIVPAVQPAPSHGSGTAARLKQLVPVRWPPPHSERVLTLRLVRQDGAALPGRSLRVALETAGLVSGPQTIYHRADGEGAVIVSAANLVRPGTLDPQQMDAQEFRGLSLFSVLPGPLPPVRMLEELVATARSMAHRLGAVVQDEQGADLDGQRLLQLRQSLPAGEQAPGVTGADP
jgi:cell division protein ZipA